MQTNEATRLSAPGQLGFVMGGCTTDENRARTEPTFAGRCAIADPMLAGCVAGDAQFYLSLSLPPTPSL
jgi:hypothetical protein